jgi:anti-sigma regulatory factor (Ser/Thr protein kinase)
MPSYRFDVAPDIAEIPRLNDWIETCCGESGVVGDVVFKLTLALEEAVTNVIQHAFTGRPPPHRIEVALAIDAERIIAEIIDNGHAFDPSAAPEPDRAAPLEARDPGGLGIHLNRRMMDAVDYRRVAGENRLRLQKKRR